MQHRHHLQLTHSLVLTCATSHLLQLLRTPRQLLRNTLEALSTTLSRTSNPNLPHHHQILGIMACLHKWVNRRTRTRIRILHTPRLHRRHRITRTLRPQIQPSREDQQRTTKTANGHFQRISHQTCTIPLTLPFPTLKMDLQ